MRPRAGTLSITSRILYGLAVFLAFTMADAEIDLRNATVDHLDNGLTIIILQDHNFPVASVQMLYRVGARNEVAGKTGLAHFLEHMAFRDSENFPDTGLVSSIYATGGEWHGYTWTDETTYFSTVPNEDVDLLLRIEADRMSRLVIASEDMEAERGAVLAEMHMYENIPSSMLVDAVMFASFLAHPYRNNTIGWESDIDALQNEDVVEFYEMHYHPSNAVLAVVGDVDRRQTLARISKLFGDFDKRDPTPLPVTIEPVQNGERRVVLHGTTDERQFMIGYRAPSANHPDFATFLVLQELLGGSSGVSFLQNDWGTPIREESLLAGSANKLTTWFPPSAQDYIFIIGGTAETGVSESGTEDTIENRVAMARDRMVHSSTLAAAIDRARDELVFDVETTEDAAHQLAFFAGLGALDSLLTLSERIGVVTPSDIQRVARTWLMPQRRTVAWHLPLADASPAETDANTAPNVVASQASGKIAIDNTPLPAPSVERLTGGIPVIIQPSDLTSTVHLQMIFSGEGISAAGIRRSEPIHDHSSLAFHRRSDEFGRAVDDARIAIQNVEIRSEHNDATSLDPETRLEQEFAQRMSTPNHRSTVPVLIVASGMVDPDSAIRSLDKVFGLLESAYAPAMQLEPIAGGELSVRLGVPVAQSQLGYIVSAPGPKDPDYDAIQILQYIFAHAYEGRLGKEAINRRGLAYYIDSRYRSDGANGWVTLGIGVDPKKVDALKAVLSRELERLRNEPPTIAEFEEAKTHLRGRAISAAQSNAELSDALARQWLWHGDTSIRQSLDRRLSAVSHQQVLELVPDFINGTTIVVAQ